MPRTNNPELHDRLRRGACTAALAARLAQANLAGTTRSRRSAERSPRLKWRLAAIQLGKTPTDSRPGTR